MIRVFRASDSNYNTNGEVILKPIEAIITKNIEEEYIEVESPLQYADFLVQDNILLVDTLTGRKGYKIHNPIVGFNISVKAWLVWQETPPSPADRGAVISHGKNIKDLEYHEDWDDVVTKLTPVGYKGIMLPEVYISVPSPYQKIYDKRIEFELPENLQEQADALEDEVKDNESVVASLENSIIVLNGRIHACASSISTLQAEKTALEQRLTQLGDTEPELKEKAVIEAQIPLVVEEISKVEMDKQNTEAALTQTQTDLALMQTAYETSKNDYESLIINNLRQQAQDYLNINKYPRINYDLEAHLQGVYEVGDTVSVKHPDMRVNLLTQVTSYQLDVITEKFRKIEFGTLKVTLRDVLDDIEEKIEKSNETVKRFGNTVTKYRSEYKRDNEEMVSKFMSELYGTQNGIYGLLQKNQSILRQTASEISGTVSRVNADLSEDIASLVIRADQIQSSVANNFTTLDGKITENKSLITQTATSIRSEVSQSISTLDGKISSNTSSITQTATAIRSEVASQVNNLSGRITGNTSLINQTATSIRNEVSSSINGVTQSVSSVEQTANKISWLVKSGTSSADFTLTDRAISLVANTINLDGYVKFTNLSTVNSSTTINGGNIKTGTIDASKATITNINAANITTGNLSANRISGGTLDASKITVTNLNASSITSGVLEVSYLRANGYRCMVIGSSNSLTIGGTSSYYDITNVTIGAQTTRIGASGGTVGFFGGSGAYKKTIATISTSATLTTANAKINEIINMLKGLNLA